MRALFFLLVPLLGGCRPESPTDAGDMPSPLLEAASRGDLQGLQVLLSQGTPADQRDACSWTPLMKAALGGHREAARRLLDAGAAVDATDNGGYTALLLAASRNHADLIDLLLARGAGVDHQETTNGWSALIWAANLGHAEAVAALIDRGADKTLRDHKGLSARDWAALQGHPAIAALLNTSRDLEMATGDPNPLKVMGRDSEQR